VRASTLTGLFSGSLITFTIVNGLVPLLPVYAARLGGTPTEIGGFLAASSAGFAAGFVAGGWFAHWVGKERWFYAVHGLAAAVLLWQVGSVETLGALTVLSLASWFLLGIGGIRVWSLAGQLAGDGRRGIVYGILASAGPLGALSGGLSFGWIVDRWGYEGLFSTIAGLQLLWLLSTSLIAEHDLRRLRAAPAQEPAAPTVIKWVFGLLLIATFLVSIAHFVGVLGRSIIMDARGYTATDISSTTAIGGLVTLPLPLLGGYLSDKVGRVRVLLICFFACAAALLVLSVGKSLWHFWAAVGLLGIERTIISGVGSALATDLTSGRMQAAGVSLMGAVVVLGGIVGYAIGGYTFDELGTLPTLLLSTTLPVLGVLILLRIGRLVDKAQGECQAAVF